MSVRTSHGYVVTYVGRHHHLSRGRKYAYEHRLVAERMLGRRLLPGEVVHHRDGDKTNNAPENLEVLPSNGHHHHTHHRNEKSKYRRVPGQPNETILCGCGCGESLLKFDRWGRERECIAHHGSTRGEASPSSKLTDAQRDEIRASSEQTRDLATKFGVCRSLIQKIRSSARKSSGERGAS